MLSIKIMLTSLLVFILCVIVCALSDIEEMPSWLGGSLAICFFGSFVVLIVSFFVIIWSH